MEVKPGIHVARVNVRDSKKVIDAVGPKFQVVSGGCFEWVVFAAVLTERAFKRGTARANTLGGEFLLRFSGEVQIKEAIKKYGVKAGENYAVFFGDKNDFKRLLHELGLEELKPEH
jgi:KEOPS complex subunit Cgi121